MLELKPIKRMMVTYLRLLKKYEPFLDDLNVFDFKRLIGEVMLFWYRNSRYVNYFLRKITEEDDVSFLAGAVILDVTNKGEFDFIMSGKVRLIDDPFIKLFVFYQGNDQEVNYEYVNEYTTNCIRDLIIMLEQYPEDFFVIPINYITDADNNEYYNTISEVAERVFLSLFVRKIDSIRSFYEMCKTYEDVEEILVPSIKDNLIFTDLQDRGLSLRDKCSRYVKSNDNILPFITTLDEAHLFNLSVIQYFMQAIGIIITMLNYHITPFIRNDVVFGYYDIVFQANIFSDFEKDIFMKTYVPYIIQRAFDLTKYDYRVLKDKIGNGLLVNVIIDAFTSKPDIPRPNEIVDFANTKITLDSVK